MFSNFAVVNSFFVKLSLSAFTLTGLTAALSACHSTSPKEKKITAEVELDEKKKAQFEAEIKLGRAMGSQLINYFGSYSDEVVNKYIAELGQFVASRSNDGSRYFMFEVLDSDSINAFSAPGGYVFITRGAIAFADNEAELAAIIGHEIAHVEGLHMFKSLEVEAQKKKQEKKERHEKLPSTIRARERISNVDNLALASNLSRYMTQNGLGMSVMAAVKSGVGLMLKTGIDHKYEYEADANGVEFATRCGYHPRALNQFLLRLKEKRKGNDSSTLEKTHPSFELRVQKINTKLEESGSLAQENSQLGLGGVYQMAKGQAIKVAGGNPTDVDGHILSVLFSAAHNF